MKGEKVKAILKEKGVQQKKRAMTVTARPHQQWKKMIKQVLVPIFNK